MEEMVVSQRAGAKRSDRNVDPFEACIAFRSAIIDHTLALSEKELLETLEEAVKLYINSSAYIHYVKMKRNKEEITSDVLEEESINKTLGEEGASIQSGNEEKPIEYHEIKERDRSLRFLHFDFFRFRALCENGDGNVVNKKLGIGSKVVIRKTFSKLLFRKNDEKLSDSKFDEKRRYLDEVLERKITAEDSDIVRVFCVRRDERKALLMFKKRDGTFIPNHVFVLRKSRMRSWEFDKIKAGDQLFVQIMSVLKVVDLKDEEGNNTGDKVYYVNVTRKDKTLMKYEVYYTFRNLLAKRSGILKAENNEIGYELIQTLFDVIRPEHITISRGQKEDEKDAFIPIIRLPYINKIVTIVMRRIIVELGNYLRFPDGIKYYVDKNFDVR